MHSKRTQIQRIIYQLEEFADDPASYNDEQAMELVLECLQLKHRGHVTALKRLQLHYESETARFLCYLLLKRAYLTQHRFDELADLTYQETPRRLVHVTRSIDVIPWFIVSKPFLRKCSGLIRMSQHEDLVIRRFAINLLSFATGKKGVSYLFQYLCIAPTLGDLDLTLDTLMETSVPGGAESIICFLNRIKRFHSSGHRRVAFLNYMKGTHAAGGDFYYRSLIVLSRQHRFLPAVAVAKRYLKKVYVVKLTWTKA